MNEIVREQNDPFLEYGLNRNNINDTFKPEWNDSAEKKILKRLFLIGTVCILIDISVKHIAKVSIGSSNGFASNRPPAIVWTNAWLDTVYNTNSITVPQWV